MPSAMLFAATICAGLFCGAALYINLVEHPARVSCGNDVALREFAPSYHRATAMQASLAGAGTLLGLIAAWQLSDSSVAAGSLLLGANIPFTLLVVLPTNRQLLDSALSPQSPRATELLKRWNALHAVRTVLSGVGFVVLLSRNV